VIGLETGCEYALQIPYNYYLPILLHLHYRYVLYHSSAFAGLNAKAIADGQYKA
jgi:hypothetical protein